MKVRFDATGDVIVVTGSANGIGRALALGAAAVGGRVVACDIDASRPAGARGERATLSLCASST